MRYSSLLLSFIIFSPSVSVHANITVEDDAGNKITLQQPAKKIISLAPHLTELLYSAGAGDKIVATVRFSNFPKTAEQIPRIGDAHNLDMEALVGIKPDLIMFWKSGTSNAVYNKLLTLGFTVYQSEPDTLEKIATSIQRFGRLVGTVETANRNSKQFMNELTILRKQFSNRKKVTVFYQFWDKPIYTINSQHLISRIIELCGGENIYAELGTLTPRVSTESVLSIDPQVIIASGADKLRPDWLDTWQEWPSLRANANNHLFFIPPELIQRHTTRVIQGTRLLCDYVDRARAFP